VDRPRRCRIRRLAWLRLSMGRSNDILDVHVRIGTMSWLLGGVRGFAATLGMRGSLKLPHGPCSGHENRDQIEVHFSFIVSFFRTSRKPCVGNQPGFSLVLEQHPSISNGQVDTASTVNISLLCLDRLRVYYFSRYITCNFKSSHTNKHSRHFKFIPHPHK